MDPEFIQKVRKSPDTIMEVLFINPLADRLLYLFRNHLPSYTPYLLTFLNFLFRLFTLYFVIVDLSYVPLFYYLAILFDGLDGKSSRWIYGKDPELRGTLDFLIDISMISATVGALYYFQIQSWVLLLFLVIYAFSHAVFSTKFRLLAKYGARLVKVRELVKDSSSNPLYSIYSKYRSFTESFGIIPFPTVSEALFILLIIGPFIGITEPLLLLVLFIIVTELLFAGLLPVYYIVKKMGGQSE